MTLYEAVLYAKERGLRWLAIDSNLDVYGYTVKPKLNYNSWAYSIEYFEFIDICETTLGGNFTNWLIDLEELTL